MGAKAPFWALARSMFPIAESLAWLLHPDETAGTSARLSWLLREVIGSTEPGYKDLASIICQVWRHGLTHGDEPPFLIIDCPQVAGGGRDFSKAKSMSWKLALGSSNHLKVIKHSTQSGQFTFCLVHFYSHLLGVTNDQALWSNLPPGQAMSRYNAWSTKFLDVSNGSEPKKAADELRALLP